MAAPDFATFARLCARVATGRMGWEPGLFWRSTYAELRVALEGRTGGSVAMAPLNGSDLCRLREQIPDD